MRKSVLSIAVTAALTVPLLAAAQTPAPAPSPITANVGVVSDYRFRGISQTMKRPALQGGFDYAHASGFYLGNWNSNVSTAEYPNANLEMDFYGGYKPTFGDITADIGFIYYYYPGSLATLTNLQTGRTVTGAKIDNKEIYLGAAWKWLSVKAYWSIDDFFSIPDTKNSFYLDGTANYDLGNGWGVLGHVGRQKVKHFADASYTDYKLGATKDVRGFVFGLALVGTNAKGDAGQPYAISDARKTNLDVGKSGLVLSVNRTF
jgi:uncharacterized protein (TIGR02001 family)